MKKNKNENRGYKIGSSSREDFNDYANGLYESAEELLGEIQRAENKIGHHRNYELIIKAMDAVTEMLYFMAEEE